MLYAALHPTTSIAEVFQDTRLIDGSRREPWLVAFTVAADLQLLSLLGGWPTQAGASMAINSGPRPRAQRWSRAIYQAYPAIHGLWYGSSMDANQPAVALYERARPHLGAQPLLHRALNDPLLGPLLLRAAAHVNYGLV